MEVSRMRFSTSKGLAKHVLSACVALLAAVGPTRAGDKDADLRALIEQQGRLLEQQARELKELKDRLERIQPLPSPVYTTAAANTQPANPKGPGDPDAVKKIVNDYLKAKKEGEDRKKKAEENEFKEVTNNPPLLGKFDNGWMLQSADKAFTMRAGVECQADAAWASASDSAQFGKGGIGDVTDGVNIRRGRLDARGTIYENFQYMIQYDFNLATAVAGSVFNSPQPTEFWGMFTQLPFVRNIRIGNQKPLWSFENWTSSRFQNFMERSLGWDAFVEDQNNGFIPSIVMLNWLDNERMTFQAGVAKNNRSPFFYNQQDGATMAQGRITFLPWYEDNGRFLLHLGLGGMYADADQDTVRFRSRTLLRNGSNQTENILTEARMFGDNESRLVPELVMNLGPFYLQAEYYMAWVNHARSRANPNQILGTFFGHGYYVQAMYFLTGEYNPYNKQLGRFERIIPKSNFFFLKDGNCKTIFSSGCWLTGLRYSFVDLRDLGGVNGGVTTPLGAAASSAGVYDISWALDWIVNPNARVMFDLTYAHRQTANTPQSNGDYQGFGMRMQFDY
jgi:phosphate-selective porin OprO and OprP